MDKAFFLGITIGMFSRIIMINIDRRQYPSQPNVLLTQIVLAFVASSLGALLVPALLERSYTSITFLSLAAEQFRQVRDNRRSSLQDREYLQMVKRGDSYIEAIARTYEVRNYVCIITSLLTVATYFILEIEINVPENISLIIATISGISLALILKKILKRESIGDIADVVEVEIDFVDDFVMKVGNVAGVTNVGLERDREIYKTKGIGIEIIPKDKDYSNAGTLYDLGQRQAIAYIIYSRLGLQREVDEPSFVPLPRRNPQTQSIVMAYVPIEKDAKKVIDAVKSCPILDSAKGKNISISKYKIG